MMSLLEQLNLPDTDKNVCFALSGGLDSTTLVHALVLKYGKDKVKALAFDFGQRHDIELTMAQITADLIGIEFDIIKLDYLKEISKHVSSLIKDSELKPKTAEENAGDPQVNTYVPFRNLQFAAITAAFAEAKNCSFIFQGLNAVDEYGYWDTSSAFRDAVNNILMLNRQNQITFQAPFINMYKDEELLLAKELSVSFGRDILINTWSCYNGDLGSGKECGACNTCSEKLTGYIMADYPDEVILNKFNVTQEQINKIREQI
jgi:7-cyano-7-deazaguanine synthase